MKLRLLFSVALAAGLGMGVLQGRTWTSADGTKTFEGEFKSYDADKQMVTVMMRNGKTVTFSIDKLSEDDQKFAKEAKADAGGDEAGNGEAMEEFAKTELGKSLRKLEILDGRSFKKHELASPPEFFILYYSASW